MLKFETTWVPLLQFGRALNNAMNSNPPAFLWIQFYMRVQNIGPDKHWDSGGSLRHRTIFSFKGRFISTMDSPQNTDVAHFTRGTHCQRELFTFQKGLKTFCSTNTTVNII